MIIIDGHNLIGAMKSINLSDPNAKEKLLNILDNYQQIMNRKIIVVFDRKADSGFEFAKFNNIEINYPTGNESADDKIKNLIDKLRGQHGICIVSSDNEIKNYAKKAHFSYQTSSSFDDELENIIEKFNEENEKYLDPISIEEWTEMHKKEN